MARCERGTLFAFFKAKPKPGRPPKKQRGKRPASRMSSSSGTSAASSSSLCRSSSSSSALSSSTAKAAAKPSAQLVKRQRTNWSKGKNLAKLKLAVEEWINKTGRCTEEHNIRQFAGIADVPYSTLSYYAASEESKRRKLGSSVGPTGTFSKEDKQLILDTFRRLDRGNDGTGRKGGIDMALELHPELTQKQAARAVDLVRRKSKDVLTGRIKAQATTTARSGITVKQQHRWHTLVDEVDERHLKLNVDDGTGVKFADVADSFKSACA